MGHEINIDSIRDLERQIEQGTGDIIQLKRARNSLLNISVRVPPEILGFIFRCNVIPNGGSFFFDGLRKGSYNFLLVCHHWFEVASRTPELWSFWGNTLKQWSRRYKRSGTGAPLDLVLSGYHMGSSNIPFDGPLRDAVRDRAARDTIRSVHLRTHRASVLTSILSSLTPDDEGVRCSSIESIYLRHVDASEFFARYRFPKLWSLQLSAGVKISSWDVLGLHTAALTTLSLKIEGIDRVPTTPQLLTILASNPRLQNLTLFRAIPRDNEDGSTSRVPLHQLKKLSLTGGLHPTFQLLRRLEHPATMDEMKLNLFRCTVEDVTRTLGPYVQEYLRCDEKSRGGLGLFVSSFDDMVSIQASTISNAEGRTQRVTFATFTATLLQELPPCVIDKLCIDFVAHTPRERVVHFGGDLSMDALREIVPAMPNIQELHLVNVVLSDEFLQPDRDGPLENTKPLPLLRCLHLHGVALNDDDWRPLLLFLTHQTSGGQEISLTLSGGRTHICKNVMRDIGKLVREFIFSDMLLDDDCPFDYCSISEDEEDGGGGGVGGDNEDEDNEDEDEDE